MISPVIVFAATTEPTLECPKDAVTASYRFDWDSGDYSAKKAVVQIGFDDNFAKKTFMKVKPKTNPFQIGKSMKKLIKYIQQSPNGKLYARIAIKDKVKGYVYSNVCEFTLESYKVRDSEPWIVNNQSITTNKPLSGQKSLTMHIDDYGNFFTHRLNMEIFGQEFPHDLRNAVISATIKSPDHCPGWAGGKNWMQIQVIDNYFNPIISKSVLFRGTYKTTIKLDIAKMQKKYPNFKADEAAAILFVIGVSNKCDGDAYLDDITIEKGGKTEIFTFE